MDLKSNELRLGNLIFNVGHNPQDGWPIDYRPVEKATVNTIQFTTFYEAIPLTEEWLLKLGFIKVGDDDFRVADFRVRFTNFDEPAFNFWTNGDDEYSESIGQDLKTVHQLQNLYFAITGNELVLSVAGKV